MNMSGIPCGRGIRAFGVTLLFVALTVPVLAQPGELGGPPFDPRQVVERARNGRAVERRPGRRKLCGSSGHKLHQQPPVAVLQLLSRAPSALLFPGDTVHVNVSGKTLTANAASSAETLLSVNSDLEGTTFITPAGANTMTINGYKTSGRTAALANNEIRVGGVHELIVRKL